MKPLSIKPITPLLQQIPSALLLIAPRDAHRGPEIAQLCTEGCLLRSQSDGLPVVETVYIADSMGDMGLWYRLAPIAMLGGSWASVGGHNPHEALALSSQVVHGPHVRQFAECYSDFAARQVCETPMEATTIAHNAPPSWSRTTTTSTATATTTATATATTSTPSMCERTLVDAWCCVVCGQQLAGAVAGWQKWVDETYNGLQATLYGGSYVAPPELRLWLMPVAYTHLTLPTISRVWVSRGPVALHRCNEKPHTLECTHYRVKYHAAIVEL